VQVSQVDSQHSIDLPFRRSRQRWAENGPSLRMSLTSAMRKATAISHNKSGKLR